MEIIKKIKFGKILLFIFSKGDPDVRGNDGVYSRYFTDFQSGEGRYDIQVHVDNYRATAYTYQPKIFKGKGTLEYYIYRRSKQGDLYLMTSSCRPPTVCKQITCNYNPT